MQKEPLVLTLDFGTQSVRAMIFDSKGTPLAEEKASYEPAYFSTHPGYAEQDPDYYWERVQVATKALAVNHGALLQKVGAMAMTCFRDSAVLLDKDKKPLRPAILWLDQRQAALSTSLPLLSQLLFYIVGMSETVKMNRKRTPAIWIQENEPDIWQQTAHYMTISTYLTYKLTGKIIDSSANQTGHFPIHFKKRRWYKDGDLKGGIFQIPRALLCDLVQPGELLGKITKEVSLLTGIPEGTPFYATGSDKGCETIGSGCLTNDIASISYGTASSVEVTSKRYIEPEPFLPAYPAPIPNLFQMEVQIYRGYWMINWFKNQFAEQEVKEAELENIPVEKILDQKMLDIPPGSQGLVLQPYWGPGLRRPDAKGAIIGFTDYHTKIHVYRAIIEGIAYGLRDGLQGIENRQHKLVKEIRVSGGGSQSDAICQITADIFGLPVKRIQTFETGSLGAAIGAFVAHGYFNDYHEAVENMVHVSKTFTPDPEASKRYNFLFYEVYKDMYPHLMKMYKKLRVYKQ